MDRSLWGQTRRAMSPIAAAMLTLGGACDAPPRDQPHSSSGGEVQSGSGGSQATGGSANGAAHAGGARGGTDAGGAGAGTPPGGSSAAGAAPGGAAGESAFEPAHLEQIVDDGGLQIRALTIESVEGRLRELALIENTQSHGACSGALMTELLDGSGALLSFGASAVYGGQVHKLLDGSNALTYCIPPGGRGFAVLDVFDGVQELTDISALHHRLPYFIFPQTELMGEPLLRGTLRAEGTEPEEYEGTLTNTTPLWMEEVKVLIAELAENQRPLELTVVSLDEPLGPGLEWAFSAPASAEVGAQIMAFAYGEPRPN